MHGSSRRRERSSSVSASGAPGQSSRDTGRAPAAPLDPSAESVASSSVRQEQVREAELAAEQALRQYQSEAQLTAAPFPYQVHRKPAPQQQSLRHVAGTVASSSQLQRIPEVTSEGSSGEAASRSAQAKRNAATMPQALRIGGPSQVAAHNRGASMDEYSRALPRNFDPVTGRKQDAKQISRRPSLPYVFEPLTGAQPQRREFPNPHQSNDGPSDSQLSTAQLQRRASQEMQSPLLTRNPSSFGSGQRNDRQPRVQARQPELDIPPTPPLGQRSGFQTMPLSISKARPAQVAPAPVASPQADSTSSAWSSGTESEPTPTASSIAAMRERNAQLESQLLPVHLTLPSRFSSSSTLAPVQNPRVFGVGAITNVPAPQERQAIQPVAVSEAEVASMKASAAPFAPATPSKLSAPPIRSNSNDTSYSGDTIALPDGTQIPTVRTDFQNLKRISLPRPAAIAENASTSAGKEQPPSVGGHVLSKADPRVVPKNDGSSRTIYSPTPQTLAAARKQSNVLQVPQAGAQGESRSDQRIPSPLSASVEVPAAPQIPHSLQFDRPALSTGASPLNAARQLPETIPAQKSRETNNETQQDTSGKSISGTTQAKSDDTDVRKRNEVAATGFQHDPRRNTFGELAPSMLEEANKKLFLYQMQQLDAEAKEKGVGSSRQPVASTSLAPPAEVDSSNAGEKRTEPAGVTPIVSVVRRESTASQRSRRDSIGSATTAFDSPTREEFPATVFRQPGGVSASAKAIRGTARETVAPPSDVQEVQEPEDVEVLRSTDHDDDGTEIDEHESSYDLSYDKRVPFVVDTYTNNGYDDDDRALKDSTERSEFRFIPISSVKAGKARRPRTRDTRVSFRSNPSHIEQQQRPGSRQHGANPTCRQCFRAGFDCAMNLQLGEGTAGRKAFQDFVAAGGLNAFSIRDGPAGAGAQYADAGSLADGQGRAGSITVEEALGRNYVDKLGEVAFGESALSRPVTRGMYNELLEEKQEQERRKNFLADHKPWSADVDDEIDLAKSQQQQQQKQSPDRVKRSMSISHKDRRLSQMTLQDGLDNDQIDAQDADARQVLLGNIKRSVSLKRRKLEEGEVFDFDPADYEDDGDFDDGERHHGDNEDDDEMSSASSDSDIVAWADRWSAWTKVRQLLLYWIIVLALQALASGYSNTVAAIIADERASEATAILLQLGSLAYNGSQGGGLFFANFIVGYGRQRATLIALVGVAVVAVIAGFMQHWVAILACQSVLGMLSGIFIFLSLATTLDLFATSKGRLFGAGSIALVLVGGQLAGPWISKLVLELLSWPWTYWLTSIVAGVLVVYDGVVTRETAAFVLFRRHALQVKRTGEGWTPEPQAETQITQAVADDLARPVRLMRHNPLLILLTLAITVLAGMYAFLFGGLQAVFVRVHGLSSTSAALAVTVSAATGLLVGIIAIYLINSRKGSLNDATGFATKIRPLYLDEKGHIDTRRPLRAKTESLLVPGIFATGVFSFALYTLALTSSFATTWFLTAFSIVLATASLIAVSVSMLQYVMDGYSPPRRVLLRDVVAREEVSTPTLLQNEDDDRFTSFSRRTAGRLAAGASRFKGGLCGRHGRAERERLHQHNDEHNPSEGDDAREVWLDAGESVTTQRDKRWLDETAVAATTAVVSLLFTVCSVLSFVSFQASGKLSFGAFAVIFASVALVVLLILLCVYLYGAKARARSLTMLDEGDAERAHGRRAQLREKRALQHRRSLSQSQEATSNSYQAAAATRQNRARGAPMRMVKRLVDALGYKPLSDDGMDIYRRDDSGMLPLPRAQRRARTPAPPLMREVEAQEMATAAAEGRRELWLAKLVASRDRTRSENPVRPAPAIQLNEATEARPTVSALKQSMKEFGGVMLGRTTNTDTTNRDRDPIGRTLNASTSLPVNLNSTAAAAGTTTYPASPPTRHNPTQQPYPLTPPPRAQPRASISYNSPPLGAAAQPLDSDRPRTPVMTRKSVDTSSRAGIMARSHSQPLGLYAGVTASPAMSSPRRERGLKEVQRGGL
ncbi:hypothetical protein EX895_000927 [Sporisorium graminicola]|uniref:Major facilitator superfamily (MFS) profile domain-containing protein n=1 Tax=Sporisorium graminicola TaxID=280036 RepID=A0A4V6EUM1_9BASI|nr:hypothetical protein EX895_000927 [Sporisorium graminicola]TKY90929.1 hypothetical protein EX895_000927 [Sporisorium graminicola]